MLTLDQLSDLRSDLRLAIATLEVLADTDAEDNRRLAGPALRQLKSQERMVDALLEEHDAGWEDGD